MVKKLNLKLALIYGLIIIITILSIDIFLIYTYQKNQFEKNENKYASYSHMIANLIKGSIDDVIELNKSLKEYSPNIGGRILVLNNKGMVIGDSMSNFDDNYIGVFISNDETIKTSKNRADGIGYYSLDGKPVMMLASPVINQNALKGTVLISSYVDSIYSDIDDLKRLVITISIISCILAIGISLYFGRRITHPVQELTRASEMILKGNLNTRVDINRKDEIGKLARTFNKMSEELHKVDSSRRKFLSDISHELKTPLTSIKALVESLIGSNSDAPTYDEYLKDVDDEIDRLSSLVKSLLTLTRLEELELNITEVSIHDEVHMISRLFRPSLEEKNITLINSCDKAVIVNCDKDRLREVLINLVDNGIKYGKSSGFVKVNCFSDKGKIFISIKDDGIGIPEESIPFIFDNLYRVDKARSRETGGYGIGLYVVKKIVELHGWSISVKSKPDEGTEFIIET